jgi:8-oxo-dGTP pyrophosphatase MutT (NUDIX family)
MRPASKLPSPSYAQIRQVAWINRAERWLPYSLKVRTGVEVAVFVTRKGGSEVLVLHRSAEQGGYWHIVAGGVEPGEMVREAAARELLEETGLLAKPATGVEVVEYPSVAEVEVSAFHVTAPDDWEPRLDWEHDGYDWCAPDEAFALLRWPATAHALRTLLMHKAS